LTFYLLAVFIQNPRHFFRHHPHIDIVINLHDRGQAAASQTAGNFQAERAVGGNAAFFYTQLGFQLFQDTRPAADITGGSLTGADFKPRLRL